MKLILMYSKIQGNIRLASAVTAMVLLQLLSNVSFVAGWCLATQQQAHPNTPNKYINKYALLQYRDENSKVLQQSFIRVYLCREVNEIGQP